MTLHSRALHSRARFGVLALSALLVAGACSSAATAAPAASSGPGQANGAVPQVPSGDVSLQGAGATFPAPLYQSWFETFSGAHSNIKVDYQANGSGAGIKAITEQTVDFGASDAAMKDEEIAALPAGTQILHVPTALGAVVIIYSLPDVAKLQLDDAGIAGIFLGTIKKWNDPAIAANNPGVQLPDSDILVVHRSDGSGTTNAFTSFLDTVSPDWHSNVGKGKEVKWPTGIGAQGNDGVAGAVKQTPGAVGYVELQYATQAGLSSALVKNAAGTYVPGSTAGVTAAAEAAASSFPADFRQAPIINGAGDQTYPIATYTYLLVYKDQKDATKAQALIALIYWALTDGQAAEESLGYAPLPKTVDEKALAELHQITAGGAPVWPSS
jgi:phosphate transport system substrate-binding protein